MKAYSESNRTSKMERFAKIVNGWKPFTFFVKKALSQIFDCSIHIWLYWRKDFGKPYFLDIFVYSHSRYCSKLVFSRKVWLWWLNLQERVLGELYCYRIKNKDRDEISKQVIYYWMNSFFWEVPLGNLFWEIWRFRWYLSLWSYFQKGFSFNGLMVNLQRMLLFHTGKSTILSYWVPRYYFFGIYFSRNFLLWTVYIRCKTLTLQISSKTAEIRVTSPPWVNHVSETADK